MGWVGSQEDEVDGFCSYEKASKPFGIEA